MRTKQWIPGINNKQKIRVICNGVGYFTTVQDALSGPFAMQTDAIRSILHKIGAEKLFGMSTTVLAYDHKMERQKFELQINLEN